jgi:uracil-DNA glycosylase
MVVGEYPNRDDLSSNRPFTSMRDRDYHAMMAEAGIPLGEVFATYAMQHLPPNDDDDNYFVKPKAAKEAGLTWVNGKYPTPRAAADLALLHDTIAKYKPTLIIPMGEIALWAITGQSGIMSWRGSQLDTLPHAPYIVPTLAPRMVNFDYAEKYIVIQDLRRALTTLNQGIKKPHWEVNLQPTSETVLAWLEPRLAEAEAGRWCFVAADIETRKGQIVCVGLAVHNTAICIPFMDNSSTGNYWASLEEELIVTVALRRFLTHPNVHSIFHNGAYDLQYFAKQWGYLPNISDDTMLMQHVAFPGLRKALSFCSSLYCTYHCYWKDDGKEWHATHDDLKHWYYNAEDCLRTFEIWLSLSKTIRVLQQDEQYDFQMKRLFPQVLNMMLRGIAIDQSKRMQLDHQLETKMADIEAWFTKVLGHPFNPRSPLKMQQLFHEDFGLPKMFSRKTKRPSLDDTSLTKLRLRYPLFAPLIDNILLYRSISVFLNTFIKAPLSEDGRMRCTYNLAGTETYRFSSSADSFGFGTNLQNLPSGDE